MSQIGLRDRDIGREPVPQPEPGLTPEVLVERAKALRPLLRADQDASDERGHYSDEIHQKLRDGGFYRIVQPRLFGGYEFDYPSFVRVIQQIARGNPSSGWGYTLATSHAFLIASHWSAEAQAELFGPTGDFRAAQKASPTHDAVFERVDGGYRATGVWTFASGVPLATHFVGAAVLPGADGRPTGANFVVPRKSFTILDDWGGDRSLGMRGSGSNGVKLDNVFIPDRHITGANILLSSEHMPDGTPGTRLHGNPMYLGIIGGSYHTEFGAITSGAAWAALDEYEELMRTRPVMGTPNLKRLHDPENQRFFGKALMLTESAEALNLAAAELYMEQCRRWQRDGTPITASDTMKVWGMCREACLMACEAVEMLFQTAGAFVTHRGNRLQRYFRDVQMYRIHVTTQPRVAGLRAQAHFGLEPVFSGPQRKA